VIGQARPLLSHTGLIGGGNLRTRRVTEDELVRRYQQRVTPRAVLVRTIVSVVVALIAAWILLYFFCHGIAHWAVGRALGIRFAFYTVGGTGNPEAYPPVMRWLFEHLPFFGVQTEKASMQRASPMARAIMWSAGVTSSAVVPTLGAVWAWHSGVPWSKPFFLFALFWAAGTLASNWRSPTGDYAKARRALGNP